MGHEPFDDGFIANTNLGNKQRIYKGTERRKYIRRVGLDRRAMIRFEPEKDSRRSHQDRRSGEIWNGRRSVT
jgi:hypothetical protein